MNNIFQYREWNIKIYIYLRENIYTKIYEKNLYDL